jgi:hypothetical protein
MVAANVRRSVAGEARRGLARERSADPRRSFCPR